MRIEKYKMTEPNSKPELVRTPAGPANKQPRKLLIALALLLVVLAVVLAKDSDLWFSSDDLAESDSASSQNVAKANPATVPAKTRPEAAAPVPAAKNQPAKNQPAPKTPGTPAVKAPSHEEASKPETPVVASNRVVLPPMDVEVVAGDKHQTIHPGSNVAVAEIPGASSRASKVTASLTSPSTNAAEREHLSPASAPDLRQPLDSNYPLLAQHSRVQGSVVLEAVVGTDGVIENLRVVSGPAILSAAAQQAVRQWRFKPYLQNGMAVETKARITVNFTIRVADNPTKTS